MTITPKEGDAYRLKRIAFFLFRRTCDEFDEEIEMLMRYHAAIEVKQ